MDRTTEAKAVPTSLGSNLRAPYGYELVLDLHSCDPSTFNRPSIDQYFTELCELIDMHKCEVHFWDDLNVPLEEHETSPHTKGTSAVCFILTSSIVIHTLDLLGAVYLNIFSCKRFDPLAARQFTEQWFRSQMSDERFLRRD
jgi:S-adenosylmethionine/arginine decarboxylase-like enzyme